MKRNREPHWIEHEHLFRGSEYECSRCGKRADKPYAVCPACGARMTGRGKYEADFVDEYFLMEDILG